LVPSSNSSFHVLLFLRYMFYIWEKTCGLCLFKADSYTMGKASVKFCSCQVIFIVLFTHKDLEVLAAVVPFIGILWRLLVLSTEVRMIMSAFWEARFHPLMNPQLVELGVGSVLVLVAIVWYWQSLGSDMVKRHIHDHQAWNWALIFNIFRLGTCPYSPTLGFPLHSFCVGAVPHFAASGACHCPICLGGHL
jgi:hypothetical protein